ncbi:MAG TPA: hypothetical protein VHP33_31045 [Polyangiaceae bacterium]|nr:hypothetical protein [Polyangiaceae bacterium]
MAQLFTTGRRLGERWVATPRWGTASRVRVLGAPILLAVSLTGCGGSKDENSPLIELSSRDVHLEAVFGGAATTQQLKVKAVGLRIELHGKEQAPWLGLEQEPDGLDFGAILFDFWPNDTTLPAAHNAIDLRIDAFRQIDPAFEQKVGSSTVHLTYDIRNQIAYQAQLRSFHAVQGGAGPSPQGARVIGERRAWKLSPSESWLTVSPEAGSGLTDIELGVDMTKLPRSFGAHTATLSAKGSGSRELATLDVTLLLDPPSFSLPRQSIALTSDAGAEVAPEVVPVLDTGSGGMPFLVETSASWLTVDGDTQTGGNLRITSAAGMKPGIHGATITLRADEAQLPAGFPVPPPAILNVSLYVSDAPLAADATFQLPPTARQPLADPLRPYVYVVVDDSTIEAYHIETGERLASAAFSSRLGNAVISAQTDQLFIVEPGLGRIHALGLPALTEATAFDVSGTEPQLALTRCSGRNQLWSLTRELEAWDLATGAAVTPVDLPLLNNPDSQAASVFQSATGAMLFFSKSPTSDPQFEAFDVACSSSVSERVQLYWRAALPVDQARMLGRRPQISADGRTICFQTCFDAQTLTLLPELPAAATEALMNRSFSQLAFGNKAGIFVADTDGNVQRFDSAWQQEGNIQAMPSTTPGGAAPQYQIFLTGDERRLVSLNDRAVLNVSDAH